MGNKHNRNRRGSSGRTTQSPRRVVAESYLARSRRTGPADLAERIPHLAPLRDRRVLLIGAGGVGAPIALDLARSGLGFLHLVDPDVVDPATTVRWPLGFSAADQFKVAALIEFFNGNHPYTEVTGDLIQIGAPRQRAADGPSQLDKLGELVDGCDLVVDASAEPGVTLAMAQLASELDLPFIAAWATVGAWGGVVARVRPAAPGCWFCVLHAIEDQTIRSASSDPSGNVQPLGCADPTYTGSSFDVATIANSATRLIAASLCPDYGPQPWDVGVIELRDATGAVTGPRLADTWTQKMHPACPMCNP
jgi:hypothetical protein